MEDKLRVEIIAVNEDASLEDIQNTVGGHKLEYVVDLSMDNIHYVEDMILYFIKGKLPINFNVSSTTETLDKEITDAIEDIIKKISAEIPEREDLKCTPCDVDTDWELEGGICKNKVC